MLPCKMAGIFHTNEISVHSIWGKKNNQCILKRCLQKKGTSKTENFHHHFRVGFYFVCVLRKRAGERERVEADGVALDDVAALRSVCFLYLSALNFLLAFTCTSYKIIRSLF